MSFNIALSGLNVSLSDLSVTGNNIANASTVGFKESRAEFADVYAQSYQGISDTAIGGGVQLATVAQQHGQGNIEFTGNALDLAISGQGFYVLNDANGNEFYTRAGQYQVNKDYQVVNSQGQTLQMYPYATDNAAGEPVFDRQDTTDIVLSTELGDPAATSAVDLSLNLNAAVSTTYAAYDTFDPTDPTKYNFSTSILTYDSLGDAHTMTTYYRKLDPSAPLPDGTPLTDYMAGQVDSNGDPRTADNLWQVWTYVDGVAVGSAGTDGNPGGDQTLIGAGDPTDVYPTGADGVTPVYPDTLQFSTSGIISFVDGNAVTDINPARIDIAEFQPWTNDPANRPNPMGGTDYPITLDFSGSSQYSAAFTTTKASQDGHAPGFLSGVEVDDTGIVFARYSNGQSAIIGQLVLANFPNPQGLQQVGDTNWVESYNSGTKNYGTPGAGLFGKIQSGAVESSNVELTEQLVRMMIAQRNFQANAQMLTTEDQVTQTMLNIR